MGQMNISMTGGLVEYVRRKVKDGRYNNASEVVREALRRMEADDPRAARPGAGLPPDESQRVVAAAGRRTAMLFVRAGRAVKEPAPHDCRP